MQIGIARPKVCYRASIFLHNSGSEQKVARMSKKGQYYRKPKEGFVLIYKYTLDDGKSYIGQTRRNLTDRHYGHKIGNTAPIDKALKEHQYELSVLDEIPLSKGDEMERFYISKYNTLAPNGYNYTTGGIKDGSGCEEWSKHLTASLKGKPKSEEHRLKIVENGKATRFKKGNEPWNKGIPMSEEIYAKAEPTMFKKGMIPWNKGKHHSEETRMKLSNAGKGRPAHNRIKIRCVETGEIYVSLTEASKHLGYSVPEISRHINGKTKSIGTYHLEKIL